MVKGSSGVLALTSGEIASAQPAACIRCSSCVRACPVGLLPLEMAAHIRAGDSNGAVALGLKDCIACGCCSFVCPSHIPLVHYFNFAKGELMEQERVKLKQEATKKLADARNERIARIERERAEAAARRKARASEGERSARRRRKKNGREAQKLRATESQHEPHRTFPARTRTGQHRQGDGHGVARAHTGHAVRLLVVRLARDQPVGGVADRRHRRRSFCRASARTRSASGADGRFRNFDGMAAGDFAAAVRTVVDRRAGQSVRRRHRQAGVRRAGAEPVQSRRWPRA